MSAAATLLANEARDLVDESRGAWIVSDPLPYLCTALAKLAAAVVILSADAESTQRMLASRTEHLA